MRTLAIIIAILTVFNIAFFMVGDDKKYLDPIELEIFDKDGKGVNALIEGFKSGKHERFDITVMTEKEIMVVAIVDGELADFRKISSIQELRQKIIERAKNGKLNN